MERRGDEKGGETKKERGERGDKVGELKGKRGGEGEG